ncbi:MAG: N-acetyltransferase [Candidatus Eisenbacteria bacterium]|nr:N-acetyltransferase [Candidatus Eisenbacteria bacterium]
MPVPDVHIRAITGGSDLHRFVTFPWRIYRDDPYWVPPLIGDTKKMLTPGKHPFHEHGEVALWMAYRDGEPVGRIAGIVNRAHNEFQGEQTAFFGFFDSIDDPLVSGALLETAARWAKERGMLTLRGPANFSTNEECAMLVDGFDSSPCVMMPYNPAYYPALLEKAGFAKAKDLVAYLLRDEGVPERLLRLSEEIRRRENVEIRSLDKKRFGEEVDRFSKVYNQAWERNWGFVPMTEHEIAHMAKELKAAVDPEMILFLEKEGEPIGFAMALPDLNQALRHANGRLFPFGLLKILYHARKIHKVRVLILGILEAHRGRGLDVLLYLQLFKNGTRRGYHEGEFSWILEDNVAIRRPLERIGAKVYKTYRFYERPLA